MSQPHPQSAGGSPATSRAGWFAMVLVGSIITMVAGGLLVGGIVTAALVSSQRDGNYLLTPPRQLSSQAYAITTPSASLETALDRLPEIRIAITAASEDENEIFIGIAPSADVADYLSGVHVSEIIGANGFPFTAPFAAQLRDMPGPDQPEPPGAQDFWAAASEGSGSQELTWLIEPGDWTVVLMNADATDGIDAKAAVGVEAPWAGPIAASLTVGASILLLLGILLIVFGALGWGKRAPRGEPLPTAEVPVYPSALTGELLTMPSRWLWLVKWILVIPHWVVLALLWVAFVVVTVVAGFAILFTGRYPRSLFEFNVGVLRWNWRVSFYAYSALGTDQYPPFTLERTDYPADFVVEYPERLANGLVLVKSWLLAIPHLVVVGALTGTVTLLWGWDAPVGARISLLGILVVIAAIILLFTGRYQRALFDLIMGINRWAYRATTYVALMRDEYPPFRLDQGSREPEVELPRTDQI